MEAVTMVDIDVLSDRMIEATKRAENSLKDTGVEEEGIVFDEYQPLPETPEWPGLLRDMNAIMPQLDKVAKEVGEPNEDEAAKKTHGPNGNDWGDKTEKCIMAITDKNPKMDKGRAIAICRARFKDQ